MKKLTIVIAVLTTLMTSCSQKEEQTRRTPEFIAVVDSICDANASKEGYAASSVKKGMHDYFGYYSANENPILKDLPFTVTSISNAKTLDGAILSTIGLTYSLEEQIENGKRVYTLNARVINEYPDSTLINVQEGKIYTIVPENGLVQYDGVLDIIGINEVQGGKTVDGRSFGTIEIKNAKFTPVNKQ